MTAHVPPVAAPIRRPVPGRPRPRSTRAVRRSTAVAVATIWLAAAVAFARDVAAHAPARDLGELLYALGFPA